MLGDVHHPQSVRVLRIELAADKIVVRNSCRVTPRATAVPPAIDPGDTRFTLSPEEAVCYCIPFERLLITAGQLGFVCEWG